MGNPVKYKSLTLYNKDGWAVEAFYPSRYKWYDSFGRFIWQNKNKNIVCYLDTPGFAANGSPYYNFQINYEYDWVVELWERVYESIIIPNADTEPLRFLDHRENPRCQFDDKEGKVAKKLIKLMEEHK